MNKKHTLQDLADFIRIQSVSTDPKRYSQILQAVSYLKEKLQELGFIVKVLQKEKSAPLLLAKYEINQARKSIGIYGHYDAQPEDPLNEWKTSPFKLTLKKGKLFGRGVADNKGPIIQNLAAIESLIKNKQLKNNIVFVLEGEEEVSSANFEKYIQELQTDLSIVDAFYLTDVGMHAKNQPQIFYSLRGIVYFELKVEVGRRDLHSGIYGNRVLNPIQVIADLLVKIKNLKTGRILIPGFYEQVRKIKASELTLLKNIERSDKEEKEEAQTYALVSLDKNQPYLSSKIYPSFDAHGIIAGFTQPGMKTIIPKAASVKFSFRLVEYQDSKEITKIVKEFINNNLPKGIVYDLKTHDQSPPFYTSLDNEYVKKTSDVLYSVFNHKVLFNRAGGSIPAASVFQKLFRKPIILTGFTLPDDNIHAPNENFDEEMFWKGIKALEKIYSEV